MQQTLPNRKIQSLPRQLLNVLLRSVEAVQDPRLLGLVFLAQGEDFVVAPHVVQDYRLLQGFREFDLSLKNGNLLLVTVLVHFIQACFTKGKDIWRL